MNLCIMNSKYKILHILSVLMPYISGFGVIFVCC